MIGDVGQPQLTAPGSWRKHVKQTLRKFMPEPGSETNENYRKMHFCEFEMFLDDF